MCTHGEPSTDLLYLVGIQQQQNGHTPMAEVARVAQSIGRISNLHFVVVFGFMDPEK